MTAAQRSALVSAIVTALATAVGQHFAEVAPARKEAYIANYERSSVQLAYEILAKQLDKRERQIERRELRVNNLEDALEECRGQPVARGATPGLALRNQIVLEETK